MLIYCVRHGESVYNAEGRIQGQSDVPLSDLGLRQSQAIARALAELPIEAVYSSPLRRAMQTAEPLAACLGLVVQTDPRLMEINAGVFQHRLRAELPDLFPEAYSRWLSSGHQHVVVVTHGGLLAGALKALLGIPAERHPFVFHNGSITRLELADGCPEQVKLLSLNETEHLRALGPSGCGDL